MPGGLGPTLPQLPGMLSFMGDGDGWGGGGGGLDSTIGSRLGDTMGSAYSGVLVRTLPGAGRRRYHAPLPSGDRVQGGRVGEGSPGTAAAPSSHPVGAASERSRAELDAMLRTHQGELRRCLDRWLARQEAAFMAERPLAEAAETCDGAAGGAPPERQATLRFDDDDNGGQDISPSVADTQVASDASGTTIPCGISPSIDACVAAISIETDLSMGVATHGVVCEGGGAAHEDGDEDPAAEQAPGAINGVANGVGGGDAGSAAVGVSVPVIVDTSASGSRLRPPPLEDHLEVTSVGPTGLPAGMSRLGSDGFDTNSQRPSTGVAGTTEADLDLLYGIPGRLAPPRIAPGMADKVPEHKRWQTDQKRKAQRPMTPLAKHKVDLLFDSHAPLQRLVRRPAYELAVVILIALNAIFIICETEIRSRVAANDPTSSDVVRGMLVCNVIADAFFMIFLVDLILRLTAEKTQLFYGRERVWNVLDVLVVFTAFFESVARWHQFAVNHMTAFRMFTGHFAALRVIRVLRIVRGTRMIRTSPIVRELSVMVTQLTSSIKPLVWSVVLLIIVLLIFGVFFADGFVAFSLQHVADGNEANSLSSLHKYFDSLFASTVTLYMATSGGIDWVEIWDALLPMPGAYRVALLTLTAFVILALLNVITAVFVQAAVHQSQRDRELLVQQEVDRKVEFIANMQHVFEELDANNSGTLTLQEFERQLEDENILNFMSTLELDIDQVRTLLTLLDRNQNGEVDIEEFIQGCLRLKGGAKSLDLAILQYQVEWILHNTAYLSTYVESRLDLLIAAGGCLSPAGIVV
eukprot:TRINITY_DN15715_c0_g1_i2.p1 TRINITY_DN15715_c0_g1~~TRINITY_DN15715_c0_g1_i2.p1  ORF type:complete len:862 (-),score=156.45 TRINITY_DN15715_c0_g1_i2:16-2433(-)